MNYEMVWNQGHLEIYHHYNMIIYDTRKKIKYSMPVVNIFLHLIGRDMGQKRLHLSHTFAMAQ